mmetsp:Transcript_105848/g.184067  ORF Transcript_105848/g.184067 Transcript_105848/m.184067 type:complete len:151 (-) Transcript_105848:462-914(-)
MLQVAQVSAQLESSTVIARSPSWNSHDTGDTLPSEDAPNLRLNCGGVLGTSAQSSNTPSRASPGPTRGVMWGRRPLGSATGLSGGASNSLGTDSKDTPASEIRLSSSVPGLVSSAPFAELVASGLCRAGDDASDSDEGDEAVALSGVRQR